MFAVNIVILAVADELYNNKQAKIGQVISIIVLPISKDISYLCYNFIWPVWSILVVFILSKAKEQLSLPLMIFLEVFSSLLL